MTTKAYLVSWLGKGNINWTPLEQVNNGYSIPTAFEGPLRASLDMAAQNSDKLSQVQKIIDPSLAQIGNIQNAVSITQNMVALTVGLQMGTLALTYKNYLMIKEVQRDVKEIKGKFELHFLDRSLDYFIENHKVSIGVIPSVLYALEKDIFIALQELVNNGKLSLPNYLEHKVTVMTHSLQSWNEVVYSTIHNGNIHKLSEGSIKEWIERTKNIANRSPDGGYVEQSLVLREWVHFLKNNKEEKSWFSDNKSLMEKAISKDNFEICRSIVNLAREIQYTSELYHALSDKFEAQDEPFILLKAS
jgi:hypothetical protein